MIRKSCSRIKPKEQSEKFYHVERHATVRTFGWAKRSYGKINLKVDPTKYLPQKDTLQDLFEINLEEQAFVKLNHNLNDLAQTKKGCIVWYTLEYFEDSHNVTLFVDLLLSKCLTSEYLMEVTTKNFLLISNMVSYGEKIKFHMLNTLRHIYDDITQFGYCHNGELNPQLCLKFYDDTIVYSFYTFVSLLYFRFRKHLDSFRRYKSLANMALAALKYFISDQNMDSFALLTSLVQMNLHSLSKWFYDEVILIVENLIDLWEEYRDSNEEKWFWISGILDIVYHESILPQSLYNRYAERLGNWWTDYVVYPPVQVLELPSKHIIAEKLDFFHINNDDVIRNMYVHLPL